MRSPSQPARAPVSTQSGSSGDRASASSTVRMPWKRRYRLRSERPNRNSSTAPASAAAGGRSRSVPPSLRMTSTAPAAASSTLDANRGSFTLALLAPRRLAFEHDLQRVRLGGGGEHVVGRHRLGEREAVRGERRRVE